ncbi:hypothetical protein FY557_09475 [Chryseobacterium sp. SN22]|uniref:hypothetical protein n=1 Tax=Chryseobacterium sp. SN22 TaxID=2606431 RepID=UPI0011EDCEAF|nr:hypothetical protein [Chryseobacterium sp. SN22]KAA0128237.1 hypothetical protein FY557_09475 [Chryseobacterium sp. SN22]
MKSKLLVILLTILFSCSQKYTGEIVFKNCKVDYPLHNEEKEIETYYGAVTNQWEYESALRELALCLCDRYDKKPDEEIKNKIIEIAQYKFEFYPRDASFKKVNFDSILMKRKEIFDPTIIID